MEKSLCLEYYMNEKVVKLLQNWVQTYTINMTLIHYVFVPSAEYNIPFGPTIYRELRE